MSHLSKELKTLKGLIVPSQWDNNGKITGIAVSCFDEEEYQILMDEIGRGLMGFLHKQVEIFGQCTGRNRTKTIRVKGFSINDWTDLIDEREN